MKSATLATVVVLAGLLATNTSAVAQQPTGTLVAVLDVAEVFDKHAGFKMRMEEIKGEVERFDQELKAAQADLLERAKPLQTMPPGSAEFTQLEAALAKEEADMQIRAGQKRKEVLDREALVYLETYQEVTATVESICDANQITLVLRYDRSEIVPTDRGSVIKGVNRNVVLNRGYDLTDMVVQMVNRPYQNDQAQRNNGTPRQ